MTVGDPDSLDMHYGKKLNRTPYVVKLKGSFGCKPQISIMEGRTSGNMDKKSLSAGVSHKAGGWGGKEVWPVSGHRGLEFMSSGIVFLPSLLIQVVLGQVCQVP